jgi:DNA primase catalytic subunit
LKFTATELRHYYRNVEIKEGPWRFSRKHFRLETLNGKWVKLNRFENRINGRELSKHLVKYVPSHVYMSVTDWLFPERVGPKHKARFAVPIGGEFVVDVDSYLKSRPHRHIYDPTPMFGRRVPIEVERVEGLMRSRFRRGPVWTPP